uniref:Spermatogenesis-associated protein 6 N-terminal domain-containing protein n=1 Tax=Bubo bubo TaxID=30461 RepID=A0A8C0FFR9_BUBBB
LPHVNVFFSFLTCPGVFLSEKHDISLSVCILGQHKETEHFPPVFPLFENRSLQCVFPVLCGMLIGSGSGEWYFVFENCFLKNGVRQNGYVY